MDSVSLIICTYNPDAAIFSLCLQSIAQLNKPASLLEIIIIDNNSDNGFKEQDYFLEFCKIYEPRIWVESQQGLTPSRLRGIKEAKGDILLFVDDDNILNADFLEQGEKISHVFPFIGAWSGRVELRFEEQPAPHLTPYLGLLVSREITENYWSNLPHLAETMPCGAGLYIRKEIARYYLELHASGKRKIQLDRTGKSLFSGGDNDLAACACDLGLGVGVFHQLAMTHYIPAFRVQMDYLLRLAKGIAASTVVLQAMRGRMPEALSVKNKLADRIRMWIKSPVDRKFYAAVLEGRQEGALMVGSIQKSTN